MVKNQTKKLQNKLPFDKTAFVFSYDLTLVKESLDKCYEELEDLLEYQQPDTEQWRRANDLEYWLPATEVALKEARLNGESTILCSAIESAILGLYSRPKARQAIKSTTRKTPSVAPKQNKAQKRS